MFFIVFVFFIFFSDGARRFSVLQHGNWSFFNNDTVRRMVQ